MLSFTRVCNYAAAGSRSPACRLRSSRADSVAARASVSAASLKFTGIAGDPAGGWEEADGPAFPGGTDAAVSQIWAIEPGVEDDVLWAGVAPAALFRSSDRGRTWELNHPLWDEPTRPKWEGGLGGLCLHSVCPWPGDADRLAVGISAAGVWLSEDGGRSWRRGVRGLVSRYLPEEARADTLSFCIHNMKRAAREPTTLYMQFHGGLYRSDDAGESWIDIGTDRGVPSDFGFPLALDPTDPNRAFVIPLVADVDRVTPDGRVRVYETRDRGKSWSALGDGLPDEHAYLTVLRQAFGTDGANPLGLYFGATSGHLFGSTFFPKLVHFWNQLRRILQIRADHDRTIARTVCKSC